MRALAPSDLDDLAALFRAVYARETSADALRWKLLESAARVAAPTSFVAVSGGRVVGHYGATPTRFDVLGRERVGLHACDAMTAPDFRRRGVLTALVTAAHDAWRREGLAFVTGLPNEAWGSRAAALGWLELFPLRWLAFPLRPEATAARRLSMPALARLRAAGAAWRALARLRAGGDRSVDVAPLAAAGEELDTLWRGGRGDQGLGVVRDRAWVAWRYLAAPSPYRVLLARRAGRPVGYAAFRTTGGDARIGVVAEVFTAKHDAGAHAELVRAVLADLLGSDAESAVVLAAPGSREWKSFRRAGFLPRRPYRFEIVPLDPGIDVASLRDPARWTVHGGDFDVV